MDHEESNQEKSDEIGNSNQSVAKNYDQGYIVGHSKGMDEGNDLCDKILGSAASQEGLLWIEIGKEKISNFKENEDEDVQNKFVKGYRKGFINGFEESFLPCARLFSEEDSQVPNYDTGEYEHAIPEFEPGAWSDDEA